MSKERILAAEADDDIGVAAPQRRVHIDSMNPAHVGSYHGNKP